MRSVVVTGSTSGIGLGLAIADRVTANHGGEISIKSTLHEGTEVVMTFPQAG